MEKQKKKRNSALTAILALGLVAIIGAGATLAYLTDKDYTSTVAYTINPDAFLDITLDEPIWNQKNSAQPGVFDKWGRAIFSEERKIIKDPEATVEEGSVDCYIRMVVEIHRDLAMLINCPPEPYEDWIVLDTPDTPRRNGEYVVYEYYYPHIMKQNQTTPPAFKYIQFINPRKEGKLKEGQTNQQYILEIFARTGGDTERAELSVSDGDKVGARDIKVRAEAVQADGWDSWEKVDWVQVGSNFTKQ